MIFPGKTIFRTPGRQKNVSHPPLSIRYTRNLCTLQPEQALTVLSFGGH